VIFDEFVAFLGEDLNIDKISYLDLQEIEDSINWLNCFVEDHVVHHNNGYLMSSEASPDASKYKSVYSGVNSRENTSFVARCNLDNADLKITLGNSGENAMLLKNEKVESIREFAVNRLILSIYPRDLIVTQNWQVAHII